jgi:general secretion pathway protein G
MQRNQRRRRRDGFTLMEVLLVLAILVILGSLVGIAFTRVQKDSYSKAAQVQINAFKSGLQLYFRDHGTYPANLEDLRAAPGGENTMWKGPYLEEDIPADPWGRPYQYQIVQDEYQQDTYEITSLGPDGQPGNDDISNRPQAQQK